MAIEFIENIEDGLLGIWELTEATEQLFSRYEPQESELSKYLQFRNENRKREWLATRILLQEMLGRDAFIAYDTAGKPCLSGPSGNISISHTTRFVAIYYHSEYLPGIDVEMISRNVERAAGRFLSEKELNDCTFQGRVSNRELMLRWCAKEAVFKMVPYTDIDFASQISCEAKPISADQGELLAVFSASGMTFQIPLSYRLYGEMIMVLGLFRSLKDMYKR